MKKFLYSTTALAVAGAFAFSGDANAAAKPISISVGGFMSHEIGYGSNDGTFEANNGTSTAAAVNNKRSGINNVQDSELLFTGSSKLDSGVTVSITIQIEADQASVAGNHIDESYMKLTGGFGDIRLGSTTGPASVLKHLAPNVGQHPRLGGSDAYITVPASVRAGNSTDVTTSGDANKFAYISPRMSGIAIGLGYTPSTANVNTAALTGGNNAAEDEIYEGVLSFETTVGTSSVGADIAAETRNNETRAYRAGLVVGFGGFKVGGSAMSRVDSRDNRKRTGTSNKQNAYDLGATYAMGAYTFGLTKAYGEQVDGEGVQDEQSKWAAGISYALDTGVSTTITYTKADYNDGAAGGFTDNNSGHAVVGEIKVSF